MTAATWRKGKRTLNGFWEYVGSDRFRILIPLKRRDPITGESERRFSICGDTPEWNGWRLLRPTR